MTDKLGSVIVSWDFSNGIENGILLVGEKKPRNSVEIVNAFRGQEAIDLMKSITTISKDFAK